MSGLMPLLFSALKREVKMFSQHYPELDKGIRGLLNRISIPGEKEVKEILERSKSQELSLEEVAMLLEIGKYRNTDKQFFLLRQHIYSQFRREGNTLRYIAPVYLSSYCVDKCGYCNFSARRQVERTRLDIPELKQELQEVFADGSKVIELTLATDPAFSPERLAEYISKTKKLLDNENGFGVLLCSGHLTTGDYRLLRKAGLWGMVQWDETLKKESFEKWHKNSPKKSNFTERIDNHDRAIMAGLQVATGCLFGLNDYRYDVLMQVAKARYLYQEYKVRPFVFGTPRLKSVGGKKLHTQYEVSDRQYELALMVYKIAEPKIARWLQTRETLELNLRSMVDADVYTYQCGEVRPGGYRVNKTKFSSCKGGQFEVNELTRWQIEEVLKRMNFKIDYAWIIS